MPARPILQNGKHASCNTEADPASILEKPWQVWIAGLPNLLLLLRNNQSFHHRECPNFRVADLTGSEEESGGCSFRIEMMLDTENDGKADFQPHTHPQ